MSNKSTYSRNGHAKGFNRAKVCEAIRTGDFVGAERELHLGIGGKASRRSQALAVVDAHLRKHGELAVPQLANEPGPFSEVLRLSVTVSPVADAGQQYEPYEHEVVYSTRNLPA